MGTLEFYLSADEAAFFRDLRPAILLPLWTAETGNLGQVPLSAKDSGAQREGEVEFGRPESKSTNDEQTADEFRYARGKARSSASDWWPYCRASYASTAR